MHSFVQLFLVTFALIANDYAHAKKLTLDDILMLAIQPNKSKEIINLSYLITTTDTNILTAEGLPTINFSLSKQQGDRIQQSSQQNFDNYRMGLNFKTPLYSFGRLSSLRSAKGLKEEIDMIDTKNKLEEEIHEIINLYVQALLAQNTRSYAEENKAYSKSLFDFTSIEFKNGGRSKIDHLRTKANYLTASATYEKSIADTETKVERLKNHIEYELKDPFKLSTNFQELSSSWFFNIQLKQDSNHRLKLKQLQRDFEEQISKYKSAQYFPTLYLVSSLDSTQENGSDLWSYANQNFSVGISLEWNLFSGFRHYYQDKQASLTLKRTQLQLNNYMQEFNIQKKDVFAKWKASKSVFEASLNAKEASALAFKQAKYDYSQGVISLTQLLEVQKDYQISSQNLANAFNERILYALKTREITGQYLTQN